MNQSNLQAGHVRSVSANQASSAHAVQRIENNRSALNSTAAQLPTEALALDFLSTRERHLLHQLERLSDTSFKAFMSNISAKSFRVLAAQCSNGPTVATLAVCEINADEQSRALRNLARQFAARMAPGYTNVLPRDISSRWIGRPKLWAVAAFNCHIDAIVREQCRLQPQWQCLSSAANSKLQQTSEQYNAVRQAAALVEWQQLDNKLSPAERERAVAALVRFANKFEAMAREQVEADVDYFAALVRRNFGFARRERLAVAMMAPFRRQYFCSAGGLPEFRRALRLSLTPTQYRRIATALYLGPCIRQLH